MQLPRAVPGASGPDDRTVPGDSSPLLRAPERAQAQQLRLAAQANAQDTRSRTLQAQGQALKELRDAGLIIGAQPEDVLADLRAATETVLEQTAESNETFRRVLDGAKRFVRE
jgi:TRAP-type mannitol/chloroaromatic compound transport system substrate-binding protein